MNSPEEKHEKLARALRAAQKDIFVPPTLDESILKESQRKFEKTFRKNAPASWSAALLRRFGFLAAPALIAIALIILSNRPRQYAREDINHDGQINILDALTLARALENKSAAPALDQNQDGQLNQIDIDAVAKAAVRLNEKI